MLILPFLPFNENKQINFWFIDQLGRLNNQENAIITSQLYSSNLYNLYAKNCIWYMRRNYNFFQGKKGNKVLTFSPFQFLHLPNKRGLGYSASTPPGNASDVFKYPHNIVMYLLFNLLFQWEVKYTLKVKVIKNSSAEHYYHLFI